MCVTEPSAGFTATSAATVTATTVLPPFVVDGQEKQPYLTQVVVAVNEDVVLTDPTGSGPVSCQLWLHRVGGDRLLDSGFIRGGYGTSRTVVGIMGSVGYTAGDELHVIVQNYSGADVNLRLAYARDYAEPSELGCESYTQMSTSHEATWVFQGTVAEDATAGTHVVTCTVTPGAGNEFEMLYCSIVVGNTATAQTADVSVDDGTNFLARYGSVGWTTANGSGSYPNTGQLPVASGAAGYLGHGVRNVVSGTMRLVLKVTTTAVSVTQTFGVVARIRGLIPAVVLNDTVGTDTPTTNTNRVF